MKSDQFHLSQVIRLAFQLTKRYFFNLVAIVSIIWGLQVIRQALSHFLLTPYVESKIPHLMEDKDKIFLYTGVILFLNTLYETLFRIAQVPFIIALIKASLLGVDSQEINWRSLRGSVRLLPKFIRNTVVFMLITMPPLAVSSFYFSMLTNLRPTLPEWVTPHKIYGSYLFLGLSLLWAVFFFLRYGFYSYAVVDQSLGAIASLKRSVRLTKGLRTQVLLCGMLAVGLVSIGLVPFWLLGIKSKASNLIVYARHSLSATLSWVSLVFIIPFIVVLSAQVYRGLESNRIRLHSDDSMRE